LALILNGKSGFKKNTMLIRMQDHLWNKFTRENR
jgi:hypothetical protein